MTFRVRRVTTIRAGGVSAPPYDSFNMGDHVGDDPAAVAANRNRLASALGLAPDHVVWMNQVHSAHVEVVDGPREKAFDNTDALVTSVPRLALAVVTADCVPVLLADARAGVIGAATVLFIRPVLPYELAFAAGAMIYVVVEELIPEAQSNDKPSRFDVASLGAMAGFALMMVLDVALG